MTDPKDSPGRRRLEPDEPFPRRPEWSVNEALSGARTHLKTLLDLDAEYAEGRTLARKVRALLIDLLRTAEQLSPPPPPPFQHSKAASKRTRLAQVAELDAVRKELAAVGKHMLELMERMYGHVHRGRGRPPEPHLDLAVYVFDACGFTAKEIMNELNDLLPEKTSLGQVRSRVRRVRKTTNPAEWSLMCFGGES